MSVAFARNANLFVRGAPVTCSSANAGAAFSGVSTPTKKYLLLATAHACGPGLSSRSPGSGLRKSTRSGPPDAGLYAYARWRASSVVSASCDVNPVGRLVSRKAGCGRPLARTSTCVR